LASFVIAVKIAAIMSIVTGPLAGLIERTVAARAWSSTAVTAIERITAAWATAVIATIDRQATIATMASSFAATAVEAVAFTASRRITITMDCWCSKRRLIGSGSLVASEGAMVSAKLE